MPVVWFALALLPLMAAACDSSGSFDESPLHLPGFAGGPAPAPAKLSDRDQDGLCDITEEQFGTDLDNIDTDADGVPDVIEVIAGFDPSDSQSPGLDQIGHLFAQVGQTLDYPVRSTFDGMGQGATGLFSALSSLNPRDIRADHYFAGGQALGAEPPDNVRGMVATSERFGSVLGNTRLLFSLHFVYRDDPPTNCTAALPFDYSIKSDSGGYSGSRTYLLIVSTESQPKAENFCRPVACL